MNLLIVIVYVGIQPFSRAFNYRNTYPDICVKTECWECSRHTRKM